MQDEAYQKEYDEARAKLEAGEPITSQPRDEEGKFVAAEPEAKAEAVAEPVPEPQEVKPAEPDPLEELRARLEKTEKALKDTQAWGTKNAQRLREIEQERERQQREASKPAILDANPELEQAIRHVVTEPVQPQVNKKEEWLAIVDAAHPGIFNLPDDDELVQSLVKKSEQLGEAWHDPLVAIREITAEKLAYTERQIGKKFMAEAAKSAQKSAMSVPGAGSSAVQVAPVDPQKELVDRIHKMSDAEFAAEVRRVKGY